MRHGGGVSVGIVAVNVGAAIVVEQAVVGSCVVVITCPKTLALHTLYAAQRIVGVLLRVVL